MRSFILAFITFFLMIACKDQNAEKKTEKKIQQDSISVEPEEELQASQDYVSEKWYFSLQVPTAYEVYSGELPAKAPVVNIYHPQNDKAPPYAIHENASASYIAFLPNGFGVDAPSGKRKSLKEWGKGFPLQFEINPNESMVYLLENGRPWALSLRFYSPPPGWDEYGSIFVHYAVNDFKAQCFSEASGDKKPMNQCDPLGGDRVEYSGEVSSESMEALNSVLESLNFSAENTPKKVISELIRVEQPKPNQVITSPLQIKGKARGYWFFEAEAPYKLVDEEHRTLATGSMRAQGEWMTEDFVPFEAEISFDAPDANHGFLVFSRSNASGKPEHDRVYRVPVRFSSN
ncbi:Immunoglobulin-like domain of spore germination [Salinimicrobium catena]|uniref:Immunoglobulin-like domain of spore germination n=1 Tax=Salinimicrobium catena TaxID=390640 RepID=A0A1H5ND29_9FLAO|nr:Gmad2 immunoglobulin-like domain-containing protein [Salinimicrobium catena]SDL43527.1 Immunoglobulin-like domain of spore germination [Salinimicrobium catena]SEE99572.1 Immunoglobulin-like domain of spore germination [Salinimicrobium catena]